MLSILFDYFNFKKYPTHLFLFLSLTPWVIVSIHELIDVLGLYIKVNKKIEDYFWLTIAPFNLLGIGMFAFSFFKKYPLFFKHSTFHKGVLYFFLAATLVNFIWALWFQIDSFRCRGFLCDLLVLFPMASIMITTALLFIYSLILFNKVRKFQEEISNHTGTS